MQEVLELKSACSHTVSEDHNLGRVYCACLFRVGGAADGARGAGGRGDTDIIHHTDRVCAACGLYRR